MSAREWQPGDVAVATFCGEEGVRVSRYGHGWARLTNPDDFINDDDALGEFRVTDARPLVVIDPEQTDLYIQSDGRDMTLWADGKHPEPVLTEHQAGPVLWAHLVATLPTRDDIDPDLLSALKDCGDKWGPLGVLKVAADLWPDAAENLARRDDQVITPAPEPTPDERPFVNGDTVDVGYGSLHDGKRGRVCAQNPRQDDLVCVHFGIGDHALVKDRHLTHADAPC